MSDSGHPRFRAELDAWICHAISRGASSFNALVKCLPGVYPTLAAERLISLAQHGISAANCLREVKPEWPELPTPHPLDYTWWYAPETAEYLVSRAEALTAPRETIVLLGAPTAFLSLRRTLPDRELILFDRDPVTIDAVNNKHEPGLAIQCDLSADTVLCVNARLAIVDPPWYLEEMRHFLWAAAQACAREAVLLLSCPPEGTRPGILEEREILLAWAKELGFDLLKVEPGAVRYVSPPFERNALNKTAIGVDSDWRAGDLAVFQFARRSGLSRPEIRRELMWHEEVFDCVRIRFRPGGSISPADSRLQSLVTGDILPTVSRRAEIRNHVDVWTSGNRVFRCQAREVLRAACRAERLNRPVRSSVETELEISLTAAEEDQLLSTLDFLKEIIRIERAEYGRLRGTNAKLD